MPALTEAFFIVILLVRRKKCRVYKSVGVVTTDSLIFVATGSFKVFRLKKIFQTFILLGKVLTNLLRRVENLHVYTRDFKRFELKWLPSSYTFTDSLVNDNSYPS